MAGSIMRTDRPNRRFIVLLVAVAGFLSFTFVWSFKSQPIGTRSPSKPIPVHHVDVSAATLNGEVIMPKLGNETAKAELGRAAWKLFHTTMARFPDKPTPDESVALQSYMHLFARLYPCGECASHFRDILAQYPPQVTSRSTAAAWGCHVHNEVNKSLKKELFDCSNIGDFYDCGCAEDEKGDNKTDIDKDKDKNSKDVLPLQLESEGLTRGG
ncbi:MAG: hypothetical protein M1812_007461 [Candelaria pacifica]|nr:MAG: hypothetical protein M1812_007461 [Candelaria pacifica]